MSKKVLILSASPRKNGNSDLLCDEFLKGSLGTGAWQIGDIKGKPAMSEAYTFGKNA